MTYDMSDHGTDADLSGVAELRRPKLKADQSQFGGAAPIGPDGRPRRADGAFGVHWLSLTHDYFAGADS